MNKINNDAINLNLLYKEFPNTLYGHHHTKCGHAENNAFTIGRIVTCHPTGEKDIILDLRIMDGTCYTTFREAAEKRGLLYSDNNLIA
ncbi:hypothetical protein H5410_053171 [Solanum commersonii]|uniref:Uncharacterized protein n=1 Tax=Solanum commersonii TaxID=4109 RepID=A0A9J5X6B6_SOLCO|nr:hypothetical protein H5410_053171 [Solanum commersonii]